MKQDQDNNVTAEQYGQANVAEDLASLAKETTGALEEISTANTSTMEELKNMNMQLMATVKAQQTDINQLKNADTPTTRSLSSTSELTCNSVGGTTNEGNNVLNTLVERLTTVIESTKRRPQRSKRAVYYCWTHGYNTNPEHTSQTCSRKAEGHVLEATSTDRQGGSTKSAKRLGVHE